MFAKWSSIAGKLCSLSWSTVYGSAQLLGPSVVLAVALLALFCGYIVPRKKSDLGIYNPKKWWELTTMRSKRDFDANAPDWIEAWFAANDKPLRFIVDSGYCTILPSSMADEFRKMKELCMYTFLGTVRSALLAIPRQERGAPTSQLTCL